MDHYNDTNTNENYGVKFLANINGYICFGYKYNNMCIQWCRSYLYIQPNSTVNIYLPLAYTTPLLAFLSDTHNTTGVSGDNSGGMAIIGSGFPSNNSNLVLVTNDWNVATNYDLNVFAVGIL